MGGMAGTQVRRGGAGAFSTSEGRSARPARSSVLAGARRLAPNGMSLVRIHRFGVSDPKQARPLTVTRLTWPARDGRRGPIPRTRLATQLPEDAQEVAAMRHLKTLGLAFLLLSFLPATLPARQYAAVTVAWTAPDRDDWGWRDRDDFHRHRDGDGWRCRRHHRRDRDDWRWRRRDRDDHWR